MAPTKPAQKAESKEPADPEQALYDLCRQGSVQMGGAGDTIEETLQTAKKVRRVATGEAAKALDEAIDMIDGAGAGIADFAAPVPKFDEFKKQTAAQDEQRLKAIQAGNDAIRDLKEAAGIIDSIGRDATGHLKQGASEIDELIDLCVKDLYDAVEAYGGSVED